MENNFQGVLVDLTDSETTVEDIERFDDDLDEYTRDLLERLNAGSLSSEEKKARWKEENNRRVAMGIFPVPEEYCSECPTGMECVEANPERFIVPECIPACKELWSKNIYTFMVCDMVDLETGRAWICLKDILLSDRNKEVLASLDQIPNVQVITWDFYYENTAYITVQLVGQAAQDALLDIAKRFEMQDVPEGDAYRIHDPSEPLREGEIVRDGRTYLSEYHLNKHLDYIRFLEA